MPAFITFGRVLFAVLFIYTGAAKLFGIQAAADIIATKVVIPDVLAPYVTQLETITKLQTPQLLAIVAGCFEVIAGVMIAINVLPRLFSLLLIIFIGATIYYFHDFWNQAPPDNAGKLIDALKNLSLIGALFMIFGYGRGPRPVTEKTVYGDI